MKIKIENSSAGQYTDLGCSPQIAQNIISWLGSMNGKAKELHIALYLFNNEYLWKAIKQLADSGCKVYIYSIPLEGYDNDRTAPVFHHETQTSLGKRTKLYFAEKLYDEIKHCQQSNIQFYIMPHMYLRSSRVHAFSRGSMPYSLHCKILYLKCLSEKNYIGITSSNLAVRDAPKIELAFLSEIGGAESYSAEDFFQGLCENSIPLNDFIEGTDYSHYHIKIRRTPPKSRLMFTAPFYENSAPIFEQNIESIINRANERIIVCAQHVCSYQYSYNGAFESKSTNSRTITKNGFLETVLQKAYTGIPVKLLSQTYVDQAGTHGCRSPENKNAFIRFTTAAQKAHCEYYANSNIHAKFIVADDNVIITTCNFTPTQFIYLGNVNIPSFDNIPGYSYQGIHCEFGAYYVPSSKALADYLEAETSHIIQLAETNRMF